MSIDTGLFMDDATENMVTLLNTQKAIWELNEISPVKGTFKGNYPSIEVNSESADFERIESGGGYMIDIFLDVFYWYMQFNDKFAKKKLNQRLSQIAIFIASNVSLGGYAEDVMVEDLSITALPEHPSPIVGGVIRCRVRKEVFLNYE